MTMWPFEPLVWIPLVLTAFLYGRGVGSTRQQIVCFWAGFAALAVALVSPLDSMGEALFSAHMIQHELLMLVAAPLLVLSRPLVPMLWGLPFEARRVAGRVSKAAPVRALWTFTTRPAAAWAIHGAAIWIWHAPALFDATLRSDWVHAAQHISFLGSALLFWWALFDARRAQSYGAAVIYLFTTAVHTSVLGALLTFARTPWYTPYRFTAPAWGVSALEDQQMGGLIMWVPGGLVYLGAALALFAAWVWQGEWTGQRRRYAA